MLNATNEETPWRDNAIEYGYSVVVCQKFWYNNIW